MIDGVIALYIFMLAAFTGYEVISRVPVILHTPLMSGSNFVHGIVLVGAMVALATCRHHAAAGHRRRRRRSRRGQRGRRLRRDRAHAQDVRIRRQEGGARDDESMPAVSTADIDPTVLSRRSGVVYSRPEAHELAAHRGERRALGGCRHAARDAWRPCSSWAHRQFNLMLVIGAIARRRHRGMGQRQARGDDRHAADDRPLQRHGRRRGGCDRGGGTVSRLRGQHGAHGHGHDRRLHRRGVVQRQL